MVPMDIEGRTRISSTDSDRIPLAFGGAAGTYAKGNKTYSRGEKTSVERSTIIYSFTAISDSSTTHLKQVSSGASVSWLL